MRESPSSVPCVLDIACSMCGSSEEREGVCVRAHRVCHVSFPQSAHVAATFLLLLPVVCQMESSGRWPDELAAIAHVKTAFYCAMAEQLSSECKLLASPTSDYMDVLKSGFVFRVRIAYEREVLLMRDELRRKSGEEAKEFRAAVHRAEKEIMHWPQLTSALAGLVAGGVWACVCVCMHTQYKYVSV